MDSVDWMAPLRDSYLSTELCGTTGDSPSRFDQSPEGMVAGPGASMVAETDAVSEYRRENAFLIQQSLKYAEDMARVYEEERMRRKALEQINQELKAEIQARKEAEEALRAIQQDLEKRVGERTDALTVANRRLRLEICQRERTEEQITNSLREKEVLLSEVHHRVKNNLQIISSLLALQCERVTDESVKGALMDSQGRIRSMALIHEQLYQSGNLSQIDFSRHINGLAQALLKTHAERASRIAVKTVVDEVFLPVGLALPCSLIINELFTNCLKHAYPDDRRGEVRIDFHKRENDRYSLVVSDNGIGLPEDLDWRNPRTLGLRLVINLAEAQLRGKLKVSGGEGATFTVEFSNREQN